MYKYARRDHAQLLARLGVVRIGTLHDYQGAHHGPGVSDSAEGRKTLRFSARNNPIDILVGQRGDAKLLDDLGIECAPGARFSAAGRNVHIISNQTTPNCFIYCVSEGRSKQVMREFSGADTCVEIWDIDGFLEILTGALSLICPVQFTEFKPIDYVSRSVRWSDNYQNINPAWIKEPTYKQQMEWRAIWTPVSSCPIDPIITGDKRLASFARIVEA